MSTSASSAKKKKRGKRDGRLSILVSGKRKINQVGFEKAVVAGAVDNLKEQSEAMRIARSLLQTLRQEVTARLEFAYTNSKRYSNTTVDVFVLYNNNTNATFTVAEGLAAIEFAVNDPDSRLRSKGFVEADSILSIGSASVAAGDLQLCADGIKRESCPSDDDDEDLAIGLGVAAGVCVLFVLLVLVLRQKKDEQEEVNPKEAAAAALSAPVELDEVELDPVVVKLHTDDTA
jgi:hypothetical protein